MTCMLTDLSYPKTNSCYMTTCFKCTVVELICCSIDWSLARMSQINVESFQTNLNIEGTYKCIVA